METEKKKIHVFKQSKNKIKKKIFAEEQNIIYSSELYLAFCQKKKIHLIFV